MKIVVDGGPPLKRIRPRAFGRAFPIKKRTSHVTIVLDAVAAGGVRSEVSKSAKPLVRQAGEGDGATRGSLQEERLAVKKSSEKDRVRSQERPRSRISAVRKIFQRKAV